MIGLIGFAAETTEAVEPSGLAALGVEPIKIFLQLLTFLLLFALVKRFAMDKIVAMLEARRQAIDDGIRLGRKMAAEKAELDQTVAALLKQARTDADAILAEARQEAGQILKQAEVDAQSKVDELMANAEARLSRNMAQAEAVLLEKLAGMVAQATATVLDQKIDSAQDTVLIERALAEVRRV